MSGLWNVLPLAFIWKGQLPNLCETTGFILKGDGSGLSNQIHNWFFSMTFWQRIYHVLFSGWFVLTVYSYVFNFHTELFAFLYLFCMGGGMVALMINLVWKESSEKRIMTERIRQLERENCELRRCHS